MAERVQLELKGKFRYAKVFYENRDKEGYKGKHKPYNGAYTVDLIMNAESYQQLKEAGCQKTGKVWDEDDEKWVKGSVKELKSADEILVNFERKHEAPYTYGGPPQVAHADGSAWSLEDDGLIGNDSTGYLYATVSSFEFEDGETGYRTNLDGIQVIDHVVYETDYDPSKGSLTIPDRSTGKTKKAPQKKKKAQVEEKEDYEDEIPF